VSTRIVEGMTRSGFLSWTGFLLLTRKPPKSRRTYGSGFYGSDAYGF
jgi:hypothetical protein